MESSQIYTCKEKQHNKFWKYEIINGGTTVKYSWGRLGLDGQEQTKSYEGRTAMESAIEKKIRSKTNPTKRDKQPYALDTEKGVKKDAAIAKKLGTQYKIDRLLFVNKRGQKLHQMTQYDPKKWVYVEVLNSWDKTRFRYVLSKEKSYTIDGVAEGDRIIEFDELNECYNNNFVRTVREVLRDLARKVTDAISKFAAVGVRKLSLGDGDDDDDDDYDYELPADTATKVIREVGSTVVSKQVVSKFAALGSRVLDL